MTERRLSPADAAWLYSEWEKNNQTVSAVAWTDSLVDPALFQETVQQRIVDTFPTFRRRLRLSRNPLYLPSWEDDPDFDITNHLEVVNLPPPGTKVELRNLISEQRGQLLNRDRPLWKIYQFQNYEGDTTAFHCRIQHSIADGWALVRVVLSLADEDDELERPDTYTKHRTRKRDLVRDAVSPALERVSALSDKVRGVPARLSDSDLADGTLSLDLDHSRFAEFGSELADQVASGWDEVTSQTDKVTDAVTTVVGGVKAAADFALPTLPGRTVLQGEVSNSKLVDWIDPIPLEPIKQAGKAVDATINDVLLAALTNALRKYLERNDDLSVADVLTSVPVSLRPADADLPKELGNRFGLIPVLLPVGVENPTEQLAEVKRRLDELKVSQLPIVSFGLISATALTTPEVERTIHKINQMHAIGVTTNVPGPRHPISIAGAKVRGMWGMGGLSGKMNLSFGIFTLDGELNFAVHSDANITPDPEVISRLFVESLDELVDAVAVNSSD